MRILKLVVAAAIAFGTMGALTVPTPGATAEAQRHYRGDGHRHYRGDGHRHWRGDRGRHQGWRNRRVCRWVWRHGHRHRVSHDVRARYGR